MDTQLSRKRWVIPCSLDSKFPLPKELWLINVLINNKFEILHQLGLSVSGWAAWKAELTWLEHILSCLQQLNLVYVSLHSGMYSRVFLRPKYTMPLDSCEVKNGLGDIRPWCVSQTLSLRAVHVLRLYLCDFLIQCSEQGDCLTCNSGSPTKRLLQVPEVLNAESTYLFWSEEFPFFNFSKK